MLRLLFHILAMFIIIAISRQISEDKSGWIVLFVVVSNITGYIEGSIRSNKNQET